MNEQIINIKSVFVLANFSLKVHFEDGLEKVIEMKKHFKSGLSADLNDNAIFSTVKVENGYLIWDNGYDICPVAAREL